MKVELTQKEINFILESFDQYWDVWNNDHEDNVKKWELTKKIKEKIEKD